MHLLEVPEEPEEELEEKSLESEQQKDESDTEECKSEFPDTTLAMNFSSTGGLEFKAEGSEPKVQFTTEMTRKKSVNDEHQQQMPSEKQHVMMKRGKKGKQKKIREKYKDQDEEERELRMQLLHQAQKDDGKRAKKKKKI